jgi:hypothetical protein
MKKNERTLETFDGVISKLSWLLDRSEFSLLEERHLTLSEYDIITSTTAQDPKCWKTVLLVVIICMLMLLITGSSALECCLLQSTGTH